MSEPIRGIKKFWHDLYIDMISDPLDDRTDKKFCEEHQIPLATFYLWKKTYRSEIFAEVDRRRKAYLKEIRAKAYKALGKRLDSSDKVLEMVLKITGDMVERSEQVIETRTNEDKIRRVQSLLDTISKKKASWDTAARSADGRDGSLESGGSEPSGASESIDGKS